MARRSTPPGKTSGTQRKTDGEVEETNFDDSAGEDQDDDEDEGEDEEAGEMTAAERRRARGDSLDDSDSGEDEDDEEEDPDAEEEEGEDDDEEEEEEEEEDPDAEEEEEQEEGSDEEALRRVANSDMVPKARFDQVRRERDELIQAAMRGAGKQQAQADEPPPFDRKAKAKERTQAILDGDEEKASALDDEIAEYDRELAKQLAKQEMRAEIEANELNKAANRIYKRFPVLKEGSKEYDPETVGDVVALRDRYYLAGGGKVSQAEALEKAVARLLGEKPGRPAAKEGSSGKPAPSVAGKDNRSIRDKRKALKTARATPANLARVGNGDRGIKRDDFGEEGPSERQLRRMTPKEKARARGDFV